MSVRRAPRARRLAITVTAAIAIIGCAIFVAVQSGNRLAAQDDSHGDSQARSEQSAEAVSFESPAIQAQIEYVLRYWSEYNLDEYGHLDDVDCANFASQSLIARGWEMDDDWWAEGTGDDFDFSSAWVSSTSLMNYLAEFPDRARELDDSQRDQVRVGDIVQFDWDNSGDRDHTGIVTRVEKDADGIRIYYAGHTDDTDYRSVDYAITELHPGADVYYWSIS